MTMITQTQQIITTIKMQMRPVNVVSMIRNYQMRGADSTGNNTDWPLEETSEVEDNNNANTHSSDVHCIG
eukprot:1957236-Ditylum_brightwellii.AAC.1